MDEIILLQNEVENARTDFLNSIRDLNDIQGSFKPARNIWSAAEITEHLFHAELGGISGMWKAIYGVKTNSLAWSGEHTNKDLSIEEIVEKTWRPKEDVPEGAGPHLLGPLSFWKSAFESCQLILQRLTDELLHHRLDSIIYPHPISGPLDARQRYEFLRFHINRHKNQVESLKHHPEFPKAKDLAEI
jgi:hypothetical protein